MRIPPLVLGLMTVVIIVLSFSGKALFAGLQIYFAGPLQLEDLSTRKRIELSVQESRRLGASLEFDGERHGCAADRSWMITPKAGGFVLKVGERCSVDFNGWVHVFGGPGTHDRVLAGIVENRGG